MAELGSSACSDCAAGKYMDTTGSTACTSCAGGTASSAGMTYCPACTPGKFSLTDSPQCLPCVSGYYRLIRDHPLVAPAPLASFPTATQVWPRRSLEQQAVRSAWRATTLPPGSSRCLECPIDTTIMVLVCPRVMPAQRASTRMNSTARLIASHCSSAPSVCPLRQVAFPRVFPALAPVRRALSNNPFASGGNAALGAIISVAVIVCLACCIFAYFFIWRRKGLADDDDFNLYIREVDALEAKRTERVTFHNEITPSLSTSRRGRYTTCTMRWARRAEKKRKQPSSRFMQKKMEQQISRARCQVRALPCQSIRDGHGGHVRPPIKHSRGLLRDGR